MTDLTRIISISSLFFLSFFCFQAGTFLCSGHKLKKNGRRTLVFIEFFTGLMLLFDALAYFYWGNTSSAGYYMVRISNFFVFICNSSIPFFVCFYVCEFIKRSRLNFSLLLKPKSSIKNGIPIQLFIVIFFCLVGITFTVVSQFTDFFYFFDENNIYHRNTFYPLSVALGLLPGLITFTMLLQNRKKPFRKSAAEHSPKRNRRRTYRPSRQHHSKAISECHRPFYRHRWLHKDKRRDERKRSCHHAQQNVFHV